MVILLSSVKVIAEGRNYSGWKQSILENYTPGFNLIEDTLSLYMSIQSEILLLAVWAFRSKFSEIKMLSWQLWKVISLTVKVLNNTFLYEQVLDWLQDQSAVTTCCLLEESYNYERIANDNDKNTSPRTIPPPKFISMLNTEMCCQFNSTWFWIKCIQEPCAYWMKHTLLITCFDCNPWPVKKLTTFCQQRGCIKKEEKTIIQINISVN